MTVEPTRAYARTRVSAVTSRHPVTCRVESACTRERCNARTCRCPVCGCDICTNRRINVTSERED